MIERQKKIHKLKKYSFLYIKIYIKWMKNLIVNKFHNYDKRMNYNLYIILE